MPESFLPARWRDTPVVPTNYEDLEKLVKEARQARKSVVEFEWKLSSDELRQLQRAAYELGVAVTGRYKCFKARILSAIRDGLDEPLTAFVLKEPKNCVGMDCAVSCMRDGDRFRVRGHATFDLVFGLASLGVSEGLGTQYIEASVKNQLLQSAGTLGWDIKLIHEERFRAVRNALYGNAVGTGGPSTSASTESPLEVAIRFKGPFTVAADASLRSLFTDPIANSKGIYLWTIVVDGLEQPWYVGQTARSFAGRIGEHLRSTMSAEYLAYDFDALLRGEYVLAAPGIDALWPQRVPGILEHYAAVNSNVERLLRASRFHLAEVEPDKLNRVEGALGRYLRGPRSSREIRRFFMPGLKVPARIPHLRPLRLTVSTESPVVGLCGEIDDTD